MIPPAHYALLARIPMVAQELQDEEPHPDSKLMGLPVVNAKISSETTIFISRCFKNYGPTSFPNRANKYR